MEKAIRDRYTEDILHEAQRRFGIAPEQIKLLDGFESFMYEFTRDDGEYILRIGHSRRRTPDMIRGEVNWINYLAAGGAGVAGAIISDNGDLVEEIDDGQGGQFLATTFVRAKGGPMWEMGGWTELFMERYGRLLGRIHRLSKDYHLPDPAWKRPLWDDQINLDIENILPNNDSLIREKYLDLIRRLRTLPQDNDAFGMIHQDAHAGNFFVDDRGHITLFDFDDCAYGHFVYDLAMVLFYAVTNRDDAESFAAGFWPRFMAGYHAENELHSIWLKQMPHFMKLREIDLYAIINRDGDSLEGDSWVAAYMDGRKERIEGDVPYLAMEF